MCCFPSVAEAEDSSCMAITSIGCEEDFLGWVIVIDNSKAVSACDKVFDGLEGSLVSICPNWEDLVTFLVSERCENARVLCES